VSARQKATKTDVIADSVEQSYVQYRRELVSFFSRRAKEPATVEDLVQVVYERLLRYRPRAPIQDPVGYLFRTARRVLLRANHRARLEQQRYLHCDATDLETRVQQLSSLWVDEQGGPEIAHDEFDRVLAELPGNCRFAILRQRCDGWSYQRIAEELHVSPNTVKDYIVRSLEHFRAHFATSTADQAAMEDRK
jgi:RNA polymerase sigma factor (sigma-70 family)